MTVLDTAPAPSPDSREARLRAFCSARTSEVFDSIVYQQQIWTPDPFDVPSIHSEARDVFSRLLRRAATDPPPDHGRILLLHGEAGSGKTHLMRAFRHMTHQDVAGYFCYMQMTTTTGNYGRYLLHNLVASLDQPFLPPSVEMSALMRLSSGVLEAVPGLSVADLDAFRDGSAKDDPAKLAFSYADHAVGQPQLSDCDVDLMRALIHLQRGDPRVKARVIKWLRCENLPPLDRDALGGLVPRTEDHDPIFMVQAIGKLMARLYSAPLVVCVDQLEDVFQQDEAPARFRKVIDTLVSLADVVPTSVAVVACLEDYYMNNKEHLPKSKLDRLERDPERQRLNSVRTANEINDLLGVRLERLYEQSDLSADAAEPTYPFHPAELALLVGLRTRDVLDHCRSHQQRCALAEKWSKPDWTLQHIVPPPPSDPWTVIEQKWNEQSKAERDMPDDEPGLARLLAKTIAAASTELATGYQYSACAETRFVSIHGPIDPEAAPTGHFLVAVSERKSQGGGLGAQVDEARRRAGNLPLVLIRSTDFPKGARAAVSLQIADVLATGGRRVVVENSDWRTMAAFDDFQASHQSEAAFHEWQRASQPLSRLPSMRRILNLDKLPKLPQKSEVARLEQKTTPKVDPLPLPAKPEPMEADGPLLLGHAKSLTNEPVNIEPAELKQHMAFLGGSGSGKTTAAISLIEQLLLRGIPAILLDRKGDLSQYADPDAYQPSATNSAVNETHAARLQKLRDAIEVRLYTPGSAEGRQLPIPVVPEGLAQLTTADREQKAAFAAAALGGMIGYRPRGADQILQAILAKAIEVLSEATRGKPISLETLRALIHEQDPALLNAVGGYEARHYKKLAQDLLTLKLQNGRLLDGGGDPLDVEALLGRGNNASRGKTRLTIINTQFLGSTATIDFWVAMFLMALDRWRTKSPSNDLQAVVLLDEADQYLPALRQPATKAPLESLLRRARSAGLGLMLATQSPGDFDYKCRDNIRAWVVGRVKEQVALNKLKPMFAEARLVPASRLPVQETGEFHLLREGKVVALKAHRSLIETRQLDERRVLQLAAAV